MKKSWEEELYETAKDVFIGYDGDFLVDRETIKKLHRMLKSVNEAVNVSIDGEDLCMTIGSVSTKEGYCYPAICFSNKAGTPVQIVKVFE